MENWPSSSLSWGNRPDGRPNAVPRFATPRDLTRKTRGPKEALCAEKLGTPYMPWQQYCADLTHEMDPTGRLAYGTLVLLVPRQSGKTTMMLGKVTHRAFGFGGTRQACVYTAQTRGKAREKWADEHVPLIEKSVFKRLLAKRADGKPDIRYANDSESLHWINGSRYGIESPTETAGHGGTNDLAIIDEAFAHVDARVEQALSPTMITRPDSQFVVVSTAGNSRSVYLRGKVDRGRAQVLEGRSSRVAYIEYSAPEDADPYDEDLWWWYMPALGYTVTLDGVREQLDRIGPEEFRRAFMNQWPDGQMIEQIIPYVDWVAARDEASRIVGPRVFSVDVTPDRAFASIGSAGLRADGKQHIEVVQHDRGTRWVPGRLRALTRKWETLGPVILCGAASLALQDDIEDEDVETLVMSLTDQRTACGQMYDSVPEQTVHIGQDELDTALAAAVKSESGGAWTWSRKTDADLSPLWAVTGARWGAARAVEQPLESFYASDEEEPNA